MLEILFFSRDNTSEVVEMTTISNYQQALEFIHGRTKFKKVPTLQRMRTFLAALGNPQADLTYLHVTGTNGKGSVVAMTRNILMAHGLRVGTFTSPFITRFNERISLDNRPISDDDLVRLTAKVAKVVDRLDSTLPEGGPTEFEIDTAIMFCYFAEVHPDVVILEVGIGGTYDSTNVIKSPIATAITSVGYDHMKYLGPTLADIASQKAGIIKESRPVVVGRLPISALKVIEHVAAQRHARLFQLGDDFTVKKLNQGGLHAMINYHGAGLMLKQLSLSLAGDYQVDNAGVAMTLSTLFLRSRGISPDRAAFKRGVAGTSWPGRMEVVNTSPLVILDGAHNLPGIQALCETITNDFANREVYVLVAILADKQYQEMLGELAALPNIHLFVTRFAGPGAHRPSADLTESLAQLPTHYPAHAVANWQAAFATIAHQLSADDVFLITGSLYFISDVRHLMTD